MEGTGLVDPDRQWHPLRLAEDFATADIMTGERVVFGVGRGYHTREVETFGSPMLDDIVMKAFHSETFSHQGKHYTLPPAVPYRGYELRELTLVPRPLRQPVECWQPVVSASARRLGRGRRAKVGAWFAGPPEEFVAYLKSVELRFPGLEYVHVSNSMGTPQSVMLEQLARFAKEVKPAFTR